MKKPRINKLTIRGFRSFGKSLQTLEFGGPLAAIWGPNSQGKTSLSEAFEFLLTGQIVRRQLMGSGKDEFADAIRNAHMPTEIQASIEAEIIDSDGQSRTLARTLISDYGKRDDCQSELKIDGIEVNEDELSGLGIVLSQPPLVAPILAQHTLGYLFSIGPKDRATYFKTILEVTDLDELRNAVTVLQNEGNHLDNSAWNKLTVVEAIPEAQKYMKPLKKAVAGKDYIVAALDNVITIILKAVGITVPATAPERVDALKEVLSERRNKTFPLDGFGRKRLVEWEASTQSDWDKLDAYIQERTAVDEKTRHYTKLFEAALAIPAVKDVTAPIDCMLCGTEESLTPKRRDYIQNHLRENQKFQNAERNAHEILQRFSTLSKGLDSIVTAACPKFLNAEIEGKGKPEFEPEHIRSLLEEGDEAVIDSWFDKSHALKHAKTSACTQARNLVTMVNVDLDSIDSIDTLKNAFIEAGKLYTHFSKALEDYADAARPLGKLLTDIVNADSDTKGWQELLDLAGDPDTLRDTLVEHHVHNVLQGEIKQAVQQIDRGHEKVLDNKFSDLSADIEKWWNLLRPDEQTFFSAVKPREGTRRTIDFEAGLSSNEDHTSPKLRNAITVFSQSQIHCLGLALFIARSVHENAGFIVLDDPILSSDDDYRANFKTSVLEELIKTGIQVIVLTQDHASWVDLENRYQHENIDMFQIKITDPVDGTSIVNEGENIRVMFSRIEPFLRGANAEIRKQAGGKLRDAAERFCKEILVKEKHMVISDYDGKNLGQLLSLVEPFLKKNPSHYGKLKSIQRDLNPANHDSKIPDKGTLKVALGNLKYLAKQYLPTGKTKSLPAHKTGQ